MSDAMKPRYFAWILPLGLAIWCAAWAAWPPKSLLGKVHDAATGKPIRRVHIVAYYDGTDGLCESVSDSTGSYRVAVGDGACLVYHAVGYRALALRWPENLSPPDQDKKLGLELREVALEPMQLQRR